MTCYYLAVDHLCCIVKRTKVSYYLCIMNISYSSYFESAFIVLALATIVN